MSSQSKSKMDISFDIYNDKGDQIRIALSYYDIESLQAFTNDPLTLSLVFYDVTLVRISGEDTVGYKTLKDSSLCSLYNTRKIFACRKALRKYHNG